ncbi:DUF5819 family protein [Streptomyces acidicola]|uniref:DUF5819 family protein n=1 Tax=Streptomyces acidicola TaxID=2596892 RepID=UPI00343DF4AA
MDAYDEGSNAPQSHGPDTPDGPAPDTAPAPGTASGPKISSGVDTASAPGSASASDTVSGPSTASAPDMVSVPDDAATAPDTGSSLSTGSSSDTRAQTAIASVVPAQGGPATPEHRPATDSDNSIASTGTGDACLSAADAPYPPAADPAEHADPVAPAGITALSLPYQIVAALALAVVAVAACVHLGMVFLHVAPSNTVTKKHGRAIDEWVYPEFEQNWMLFAPNPLQQNISVQVRAEVRTADGSIRTTGWYDLAALDGAAIDGSLLPSHTRQNELRRAWELYVGSHDSENRPTGQRGDLAERYLRRIVVLRLERENAAGPGGLVEHIQVRSRTTNVPPPEWSEEKVSDKPIVRELPWWKVAERDRTEAGP